MKETTRKLITIKWNIVNDQSKSNHGTGNEIIYNTEVFKSNFRDYNDAYILVRGNRTCVRAAPVAQVAFKNCAPCTKYIRKIDETAIDDAKNLYLVVPMYNLIEATGFNNNIASTNDFKSFKYNSKLLESHLLSLIQIKLMEF